MKIGEVTPNDPSGVSLLKTFGKLPSDVDAALLGRMPGNGTVDAVPVYVLRLTRRLPGVNAGVWAKAPEAPKNARTAALAKQRQADIMLLLVRIVISFFGFALDEECIERTMIGGPCDFQSAQLEKTNLVRACIRQGA